ncbi:hypothetical protein ACP70R_030241 [Stipagrostis hirtigluma subsp. patula]
MALKIRTAADIVLAASAAYAVFGAAVAYPAAAPTATALAFVLGYGALLFLLPFSVFALQFLRAPRPFHQTPKSIVACAVATPVALLAAVLAVLGEATRAGGDVASAARAVWAVDVAAVAALLWCLTNGWYTPVGFNRMLQFADFMDAFERNPEPQVGDTFSFFLVGDRRIARRKAIRFVFAVSAACAVAGGTVVGALSSGGLYSVAAAAAVLFALPMCLLYVPEYHVAPYPAIEGVLERNPMAAWYVLLSPVALVLCHLVAAVVKATATATARDGTFVAVTAAAGAMWAVDAAAAVLLGRCIASEIAKPSVYRLGSSEKASAAKVTEKPSILRSSSSEIASAFVMVWLRYWLYLHVFDVIGSGGHPRWFSSPKS